MAAADAALTPGLIYHFWHPLALSWIFMALEGPASTAIVSGLPDKTVQTAGLQVLMSLSIMIESPVIDLLTTSTTFAKSAQAFRTIRRFAWLMMALVAVVHSLVAFTPLYDFATLSLLQLDPEVAEATRRPAQIMALWSAMVGWRRFLHGVMIRHGDTQPISFGTLVRLATVAAVGFGLARCVPGIPGLEAAAWALLASVFAESAFIHFVSRRVVRPLLRGELHDADAAAPSLGQTFKFHAPLTASTFLMISSMPLVTFALARLPDAVVSLAAWQAAMSLGWLFRAATFALPEVVIALYTSPEREEALRKFCLSVGAVLSGIVLVFSLSGLDRWVFLNLMHVEPVVAERASLAILLTAPLPILSSAMALSRGLLTSLHATTPRLWGIAAGLGTLAAGLAACVAFRLPALSSVSIVLAVAAAMEWLVLRSCWIKRRSRRDASA